MDFKLLPQVSFKAYLIGDLMPCAVRYADGRSSYVTSLVNGARSQCIKFFGMEFSEDKTLKDKSGFAVDGSFGHWDHEKEKFVGEDRE